MSESAIGGSVTAKRRSVNGTPVSLDEERLG
jgi:hypothetical protein